MRNPMLVARQSNIELGNQRIVLADGRIPIRLDIEIHGDAAVRLTTQAEASCVI